MGLVQTAVLNRELRDIPGPETAQIYGSSTLQIFNKAGAEATPVIICALNEENDIAATLVSLSLSEAPVRPIVIDNGSEDETAAIASSMGAILLEEPLPSKMKAQQLGVKYALAETEHHSLLFTDADTILGKSWAGSMLADARNLDTGQGGLLFGHVGFTHGESPLTNIVRNTVHAAKQTHSRIARTQPVAHGANTVIWLDNGGCIEKGLHNLATDVWPQDMAVRDSVLACGGIVKASLGVKSVAFTRGDRYKSFREY